MARNLISARGYWSLGVMLLLLLSLVAGASPAVAATENVLRLREGGGVAVDTLRQFPEATGDGVSLRAPSPEEIDHVDQIVTPEEDLDLLLASRLIVVLDAPALPEVGFERLILAYDAYTDGSGAYRGMQVNVIDEVVEFVQDSALLAEIRSGERCLQVEGAPCLDTLTCFSAGYYCAGAQDLERALDTAGNSCVIAGGAAKVSCKIMKEMVVAAPNMACGLVARACVAGGTLDRLECSRLLDDPTAIIGDEDCDMFGAGGDFATAVANAAAEEVQEKPGEVAALLTLMLALAEALHAVVAELAEAVHDLAAATPAKPVADTVFNGVVPNITDPYCGASPFC